MLPQPTGSNHWKEGLRLSTDAVGVICSCSRLGQFIWRMGYPSAATHSVYTAATTDWANSLEGGLAPQQRRSRCILCCPSRLGKLIQRRFCLLAERQSVYFAAAADLANWLEGALIPQQRSSWCILKLQSTGPTHWKEVLLLSYNAVGVFCNRRYSRLGQINHWKEPNHWKEVLPLSYNEVGVFCSHRRSRLGHLIEWRGYTSAET